MKIFTISILILCATSLRAEKIEELQARIDTWWKENGKTIEQAQDRYKQDHPVYFQGLKTHADLPDQKEDKTDDKVPDKAGSKPTGQDVSWIEFAPAVVDEPLPCALTIDVYDGPLGKGYVISLTVKYEGVVYVKRINTGPETLRDTNWEIDTEAHETKTKNQGANP